MTVPAVMFIEMAMDAIPTRVAWLTEHEVKEFHMLGDARKAKVIESAGGDPMTAGYLLGLETARALLSGMPAAALAKVSI